MVVIWGKIWGELWEFGVFWVEMSQFGGNWGHFVQKKCPFWWQIGEFWGILGGNESILGEYGVFWVE